jgi:hypothetical protein
VTTPSADHARPVETEKLLASLDALGPTALSSCPGWSAHHIAGHVAGNYQEVRHHLEAFAAGSPLQQTRSHEHREAPLRELPHGQLLALAEREELSMRRALAEVLEQAPDAHLRWTGRTVRADGFGTHMRSEDAVHRWDLVGDDEDSTALLGQQKLIEHAVGFIGAPLFQRGLHLGAGERELTAVVRADGRDDLVVTTGRGRAALAIEPQQGEATIHTDPAARLLLLWGRRATPFYRLRVASNETDAGQVQLLLSGY